MKKTTVILIIILGLLSACKDKTPEPDEYFSFYADGVYYNYPQIKDWGIMGDFQTLEAKLISATVGYKISGRLKDFPKGAISMSFSGGHIPDQDTMTLTEIYI